MLLINWTLQSKLAEGDQRMQTRKKLQDIIITDMIVYISKPQIFTREFVCLRSLSAVCLYTRLTQRNN